MRGATCGSWALVLVLAAGPPARRAATGTRPTRWRWSRRATERRLAAQADSSLESYRTRAHGFVFFLAQVGEGLTEPPRLVKADELRVEVYWRAPDRSKQVILGWRDGAFLPTDISYHRDHLGIVTNNFGNVIRIGEGDEVRDVPHPLSPGGLASYDYALGDSLAIRTAAGETVVREVQVRPRSFRRPLVVGTLYLDAATAQLVRFRFSFTPAAYLDRPARGHQHRAGELAVRAALLAALSPGGRDPAADHLARFPGARDHPRPLGDRGLRPQRAAARQPVQRPGHRRPGPPAIPPTPTWTRRSDRAIAGVAPPVNRQDMDALRVEVERIAGARALSGLPANRLATGSVSDVVQVNRVQGLALGFGGVLGWSRAGSRSGRRSAMERRTTGSPARSPSAPVWAPRRSPSRAARRISDLSDLPVIAPALNSLLAQEAGKDYGDYVLLESASLRCADGSAGAPRSPCRPGVEDSRSVGVRATPATGSYRPNPALGSGTYRVARLELERASGGIAVRRDLQGRLTLEGGEGPGDYLRATAEGRWLTTLAVTSWCRGSTSGPARTAAAHRSFAIGGRGTLLGEPFRAYGGRKWPWRRWSGGSRSRCRRFHSGRSPRRGGA